MVLNNWSTFSWKEGRLTITFWVKESLNVFVDKSNRREPYKVYFNIDGPKSEAGLAEYRQKIISEIQTYVRYNIITHAKNELGKELMNDTLFVKTIAKATGITNDKEKSTAYWIRTYISEYP